MDEPAELETHQNFEWEAFFMEANVKKEHFDIDYTFERVPETNRKGFWSMFVIMLGFTFFSASMWTGV